MENETLRQSPSDADRGRHRDVDAGGADVGELVESERRLVRHDADNVGPSDLRPKNGFHVVAKPGNGEPGVTVHTARKPLEVALLDKLDEPHLVQASRPRLRSREVTGLVLGEFVENAVPLALLHRRVGGNNIMSMLTIAKRRKRSDLLCTVVGFSELAAEGWQAREVYSSATLQRPFVSRSTTTA